MNTKTWTQKTLNDYWKESTELVRQGRFIEFQSRIDEVKSICRNDQYGLKEPRALWKYECIFNCLKEYLNLEGKKDRHRNQEYQN